MPYMGTGVSLYEPESDVSYSLHVAQHARSIDSLRMEEMIERDLRSATIYNALCISDPFRLKDVKDNREQAPMKRLPSNRLFHASESRSR